MFPRASLLRWPALLIATFPLLAASDATNWPGALVFDSDPHGRFEFQQFVGERIRANETNWLLRAPLANPGMLEMFRVRDRLPAPQLVPWAGEFVGKYLISAVQALRLSENPDLRRQTAEVVAELITMQADDGYLGPFPKEIRLKANWDLWGHYHCIEGLLLWHEQTGDAAALACARRAADLVCQTYLDSGHRVIEAGDPEMNMAIIHGLGMLHRATGEPRYLRMMREVERDWERAGDYLRAGLDGREFFQSPRPRWESIHDLQGLLELWRITGDAKYRDAFAHHWRSIRRHDRRNTGGFSSGEQATGNPYAPTAIETCCTVAWMALTLDYLRLTGDPRAADDLELATLNGGLGAQHPSGRWWTYSTPMDGAREASAHSIVFQARVGTPELNCCSVNGPRVLGMLSEWAVMTAPDGMVVNSYLPGRFAVKRPDGDGVVLLLDRDYPREASQRVFVFGGSKAETTLRLRIPAWSKQTRIMANFPGVPTNAPAGSYLEIRRRWEVCDEVVVSFDFGLRAITGANEAAGKVSLYRGPLLLAWDQAQTGFDETALPALDLARLAAAKPVELPATKSAREQLVQPWLALDVPASDARSLRLVDFASAGAAGTRYRSWLTATNAPPPPAVTLAPGDGVRVPPGRLQLRWRGPKNPDVEQRLEFADSAVFNSPIKLPATARSSRLSLETTALKSLGGGPVFWRVVTHNTNGETIADGPVASFTVDESLPVATSITERAARGPKDEIVVASLRAGTNPAFGEMTLPTNAIVSADGTELPGERTILRASVTEWPDEDFTVTVRVRIARLPEKRLGQVFSAWAGPSDDPLRLVVDGGKLFARFEGTGGGSTPGIGVEPGRWYAVAAVKEGARLTLYVDGKPVGSCAAPEFATTQARDCALGGNPHYGGDESLAARFADFRLLARALTAAEVAAFAQEH